MGTVPALESLSGMTVSRQTGKLMRRGRRTSRDILGESRERNFYMNLRSYEELMTLQKVIILLKSNSNVIRMLINALNIYLVSVEAPLL